MTDEKAGSTGEMREEEKRSCSDDQKQFARGLARSTFWKRERKREREAGRKTRCESSFSFLLRGSLSTAVKFLSHQRVSFYFQLYRFLSPRSTRRTWTLRTDDSSMHRGIMKPYWSKNDGDSPKATALYRELHAHSTMK